MKKRIQKDYLNAYALACDFIGEDGRFLASPESGIFDLPLFALARADALRESRRWGEPCLFFTAPGILSWIVPMEQNAVLGGGISGGEVRVHDDSGLLQETIHYLVHAGMSRAKAEKTVRSVPSWPLARTREAAAFLFRRFYEISGWEAVQLARNRDNALQQRQIAEQIHQHKGHACPAPLFFDEERTLLSQVRVGDRIGALKTLNRMLALIFLHSPRIPLVKARSIEFLGYIVRVTLEENPMHEPLLDRHQAWIEQIMAAPDFEDVCAVLRRQVDEYMDIVVLQGFNRSNRKVQTALDFLAKHYTSSIRLADVAKCCGLSQFRIAHLVKRHTGKSVFQHIKRLRIQKARQLLESSERSSSDIALELGFTDQSYFIKQFRQSLGVTPEKYRSRHHLS
jgi:AraC-like DNA-binding protein